MIVQRKKLAQGIYDFADQYREKPGRLLRQQQEGQFQQRFAAEQEAQRAAQGVLGEERTFQRGERERVARQREADAELRRLLAREATKNLRPTAADSPRMAALGMLGNVLGRIFPGTAPLDPDTKIAGEENRKWDSFEKLVPDLSPEGARLAFQYLQGESQQRMEGARYGALARRMGQLTMPAKSPAGSEMPGLDPEDPEQAELLGQIQSRIDARGDPQEIEDLISELEGEQKRDRLLQIKRGGKLGQMEEALTAFPSFASQEEIDQAHGIYLDLQRDQTRDPDDAWDEFRQQLFGGRSRWQTAFEQASKLTLKDRFEPRLPTEGEVYEVGAVLYPHDPRFRTDIESYPRSPMSRGQSAGPDIPGGGVAAQPGVGAAERAPPGGAPLPRSMSIVNLPLQGRSPTMAPPAPEVRAAREKITPEVMESMGSSVDKASSLEEADKAIAGLARKAGIEPANLPEWLLKTLFERFQTKRSTLGGQRGLAGEPTKQAAQGEQKEAPTPRSMSLLGAAPTEGMTKAAERPHMKPAAPEPSKEVQGPETAATEFALKSLDERRSAIAGRTLGDAVPKRWKKMDQAEQKSAEGALKAAIAATERFDFHGALAPALRKLGIDLGSIPKDVAQRLRDALKKERAKRK